MKKYNIELTEKQIKMIQFGLSLGSFDGNIDAYNELIEKLDLIKQMQEKCERFNLL